MSQSELASWKDRTLSLIQIFKQLTPLLRDWEGMPPSSDPAETLAVLADLRDRLDAASPSDHPSIENVVRRTAMSWLPPGTAELVGNTYAALILRIDAAIGRALEQAPHESFVRTADFGNGIYFRDGPAVVSFADPDNQDFTLQTQETAMVVGLSRCLPPGHPLLALSEPLLKTADGPAFVLGHATASRAVKAWYPLRGVLHHTRVHVEQQRLDEERQAWEERQLQEKSRQDEARRRDPAIQIQELSMELAALKAKLSALSS